MLIASRYLSQQLSDLLLESSWRHCGVEVAEVGLVCERQFDGFDVFMRVKDLSDPLLFCAVGKILEFDGNAERKEMINEETGNILNINKCAAWNVHDERRAGGKL